VTRNHLKGKPRLALELRGNASGIKVMPFLSVNSERRTMDEYLTIQEVAALYAVSEKTVRNWISEGKLEARRIGGRIIRIESRSLDFLSEPVHYRGYTNRRERRSTTGYAFMRFGAF
jgi:excisionase family DNA binding protein